ncbi:ABC transporter ATP-binding protein [Streptomyces sp. DSM 44917]|uniref:ABC transporter ATP-binding protein n=1 Tax=Streptomyces boetiae TaxID=3075541 RepID=A0ABU2LBN3_9ACTN|nr:ABC transporter ATP-binding protein [Streptomyces sp. DSM 44917]MDT0308980.1 ABC transporter ATP-binding protein [Streptomyces sp. DSM 44917]
MDDAEDVIGAQELRRRYGPRGAGGFEAVRGLSFEVRRGEVFALLGTNGAGKTSTVELLEGLAEPSGGSVRVLGRDPFRERAAVRPFTGVMLQEGGFPADLTAAETARMWAGCLSRAPGSRAGRAAAVSSALDRVGLAARAGVRVKQLSGGERRRLDLALALLGRPRVLFLDEPTTGLDPRARRDTWEVVRELRERGVTVLLTTHYLEEAEALADRLAIMREGRIVAAGTPAEVAAREPARIRFDVPAGPLAAGLLPEGTTAAVRGGRVELRTRDLQRTLLELLLRARDLGVALPGLDARSASLEEVFLTITRDGAHGAAEHEGTAQAAGAPARDETEVTAP